MTKAEVRLVLAAMPGTYRLMAKLLYGCGLRLMECVRLRGKDIDLGQNQIIVRDGKGMKDDAFRVIKTHLTRSIGTNQDNTRTGLEKGIWGSLSAISHGKEISERGKRIGLAICISI